MFACFPRFDGQTFLHIYRARAKCLTFDIDPIIYPVYAEDFIACIDTIMDV